MSWQSFSRWSALAMLGPPFITSSFGATGLSPASGLGIAVIVTAMAAIVFSIIAAIAAWESAARQQAVLLFLSSAAYSIACASLLAPAFAVRLPLILPAEAAIGLLVPCLMVTFLLSNRPLHQSD